MKPMNEKHLAILRRHMVEVIAIHADLVDDEIGKAVLDDRVLQAMLRVPRHFFVPEAIAHLAYQDMPLPIGFEKTISQPFISALMTDLLAPAEHESLLEIGTGLGYHTAVLAELAGHVWSVEIVEEFADSARLRLGHFGYTNIDIRIGDGSRGWSEHAPFDKIMVTAAPDLIPPPLLHQLKKGGRMVIPAGLPEAQQLILVRRDDSGRVSTTDILPVRFSLLEGVD